MGQYRELAEKIIVASQQRGDKLRTHDLEALIAAHFAERDAANARRERDDAQLLNERDEAEDALSESYRLVMGRSPEWSNLFGKAHALAEMKDTIAERDAAARRLVFAARTRDNTMGDPIDLLNARAELSSAADALAALLPKEPR